mgnify:CR=1 FL=1
MRRALLAGLTSLALGTGALQAQVEVAFEPQKMIPGPWKFDNFPYFTVTPNDGFMLIGRAQYGQAADYLDRVSMARRFAIEGGLSPSGSRFVALMVDVPRLAKGWRLAADFRLERNNRFGAFDHIGLSPSLQQWDQSPEGPYARVRRLKASARIEVTRTLVGSLAIAASGTLSKVTWSRFDGPATVESPVPAAGPIRRLEDQHDAVGRVALVLDLRDREFEPQKGALLEGGVYAGSFGEGYTGAYAIGSGFVNPRFGTVIAARVGGRSVSAGSPLDARYIVPAWENPLIALGGSETHRALDIGRYAGQGVIFGSLEIRQIVVDGGDMLGIYGLAFLDVGRSFEREEFRITTEGLKVGGGLGVAIRILRANIFNITAARGPDGTCLLYTSDAADE